MEVVEVGIVDRIRGMMGLLSENKQRRMLALEAKALGRKGVRIVQEISGVSQGRIRRGLKELDDFIDDDRIRKKGGGRKKKTVEIAGLEQEVQKRVEVHTLGDPESPLKWSSRSMRKIAANLKENNYDVSHTVVRNILKDMGYSLQANKKTREGSKKNPDRDAQFRYINEKAKLFMQEGQPVLSIDTKKKELIGNFKNHGREYAPKGEPTEVNIYDYPSDALCRAIPYGVYDITRNEGWISLGISNDTAEFSVEAIRRWCLGLGKASYPEAKKLMLTADCGGSNGVRVRLFKRELQKLANQLNIEISVCHFPPGTSKWNKIEHRLFSFISQNWRGKPLLDLVTVVNLVGNTRTNAGLKVCCEVDDNIYEKGIKVSNEEFDQLNIVKDEFHGEWNYTIKPQII